MRTLWKKLALDHSEAQQTIRNLPQAWDYRAFSQSVRSVPPKVATCDRTLLRPLPQGLCAQTVCLANLTVTRWWEDGSQSWVTPRSSCLPDHTFAGNKDQLGFLAFCLCYKKYVNIYLSKGRIRPRSTRDCSDSSVHMISLISTCTEPHSSVRGRV